MSKATPSRADPSKWGCSRCDYGHDEGRSRNGVYKHFKKNHENVENIDNFSQARSSSVFPEDNSTKSVQEESEPVSTDYVQNESLDWGSVEWDESTSSDEPPKARTIPKPLSDMAHGRVSAVSAAAQGQVVRFGFMTLDRMLTHWGRGVMSKPDWEIERSPADYDTLEASTVALMEHYGVSVAVSPLMVWTATVGSAYAPPLMHIRKNADPNRKGRLGGLLRRLIPRRRRKKKEEAEDEPRTNA